MTARTQRSPRESPIAALLPARPTPGSLAIAAQGCTACDLYRSATQAVFGEGAAHAAVMLCGEAPGNDEDLAGHPFVGPAGRLLRQVLAELSLDPASLYLTNAVKHFKWEPRGKRRLHVRPSAGEMTACRPWLEAELAVVRPRLVVALGAVAAQTLMGPGFRVTASRGQLLRVGDRFHFLATLHPSAVLRMPTPEERARARADLAADLAHIHDFLDRPQPAPGA